MLFSVVIETTQCLLPTRTSSLIDVCTNTLGALFGAIAARTSLRVVEQTTEEEARRAFRRNAIFLSPAAYSLVLVASQEDVPGMDTTQASLTIRSRFSTTPSCALEHMPSGPH